LQGLGTKDFVTSSIWYKPLFSAQERRALSISSISSGDLQTYVIVTDESQYLIIEEQSNPFRQKDQELALPPTSGNRAHGSREAQRDKRWEILILIFKVALGFPEKFTITRSTFEVKALRDGDEHWTLEAGDPSGSLPLLLFGGEFATINGPLDPSRESNSS